MKSKEIGILDTRLTGFKNLNKRYSKFLIIWTLIALTIGTYAFFKVDKESIAVLIITILAYIGIGVWIVVEHRKKQNKERLGILFLKNKDLVRAVIVKTGTYIQLTEQYEEGDYYLFEIAEDKILFFGGPDFYPDDQFPSDNFEIVEGRGAKNEIVLLELFNHGVKIEPIREISGEKKWDIINTFDSLDMHTFSIHDERMENYLN